MSMNKKKALKKLCAEVVSLMHSAIPVPNGTANAELIKLINSKTTPHADR